MFYEGSHGRAAGRKLMLAWSFLGEIGIHDVRAHLNRCEAETP
jgi:hypothetical protein